MDLTNILITLLVGAVIGWLASLIMNTSGQMGLAANIFFGILGSAVGPWLAGKLGLVIAGQIGRWVIAVLGAVVLIAIFKALKLFK